ncbi:MAG TPA: MFS transporter [Rectinemataceae bacterium]|nr:MFS transporter [Rectinemataceae bacterium]
MRNWKRDIAIFLSSQTISLFGSSLVQYAIVWHITLATKSGLMMTAMILFGFLPLLFLSPFAGVVADRHDRRMVIVLADAAIALVTLALALVYRAGNEAIWLLLVASAIRAAGQAFHGPAVGAILPQIVPTESLVRINALNGSIQSTLMLLSPMVAGVLLSFLPLHFIFFIDVGTAAIAITVLLVFLKIPPHAKATEPASTGYFEDMGLGFSYVRGHRYLVGLFSYTAILFFLITPSAFLTPLQAARTYGPEVWRLTGIEVAFSLGMTIGGGLLALKGGLRNRMATVIASNLAMAVCAFLLGLAPPFWLYLGVMGLFGVAMPYFNTPFAVMIQEHVESDYLGRVYSVLAMIQTSVMPLAMLAFGPLGDLIKIEWLLLATGALMLLSGLLRLRSRALMATGIERAWAAKGS